jgi:hypothetical protein
MTITVLTLRNLFQSGRRCGRNLRWKLSGGTLRINGHGRMRDYYLSNLPWRDRLQSVTKIVIGNGATTVGDYAFAGCTSLTSVSLPAGLTGIYGWAFYGCNSLAEITVPDSVVKIGSYAFAGCKALSRVTNLCQTPQDIPASVFDGVDLETATLCVPDGTEEIYRNAPVWQWFGTITTE